MATSKNCWSENLLVGLLMPFYRNFPPVNKKFLELGGDGYGTGRHLQVLSAVGGVLRGWILTGSDFDLDRPADVSYIFVHVVIIPDDGITESR
jgi:hypothetical protein